MSPKLPERPEQDTPLNLIKKYSEDNKSVCFILIEHLHIQGWEESESKSYIYCDEGLKKDEITETYKKVIESYTEKYLENKVMMSEISEFYFGPNIWCKELEGSGEAKPNNLEWKPEGALEIDGSHVPEGRGPKEEDALILKDGSGKATLSCIFNLYCTKFNKMFGTHYKYVYILLIPIALKNKKNKEHKERIGALFLHIGTTERIKNWENEFLFIYKDVIISEYYNNIGEVLEIREERRNEAVRAKIEAERLATIYNIIEEPLKEITDLFKEMQFPISTINSVISPIDQFIFSGQYRLGRFFESDQDNIDLKEYGYKNSSLIVKARHTFDSTFDSECIKNYIAAVLLISLDEIDDAREPLWQYLRLQLTIPPNLKKPLVNAIKKSLPEFKENPTKGELKNIFDKIKILFHTSHKEGAGLPFDMLEFLSHAIEKNIEYIEYIEYKENCTIHIASCTPIDTIVAINSIHHDYILEKIAISQESESYIDIDLHIEKDPRMTKEDADKLLNNVHVALKSRHTPRGSSTKILSKLFSKEKEISFEESETGYKFFTENEEFSFEFVTDEKKIRIRTKLLTQ